MAYTNPPKFSGNLAAYFRELHQYLTALQEDQVNPEIARPVKLHHKLTDLSANLSGVVVYDPVLKEVMFSADGDWLPINRPTIQTGVVNVAGTANLVFPTPFDNPPVVFAEYQPTVSSSDVCIAEVSAVSVSGATLTLRRFSPTVVAHTGPVAWSAIST